MARGNLGDEIVFAANVSARHAAEQRKLADVDEGVGNGALEELFRGFAQGKIRSQVVVKCLQGSEEARRVLMPRKRF